MVVDVEIFLFRAMVVACWIRILLTLANASGVPLPRKEEGEENDDDDDDEDDKEEDVDNIAFLLLFVLLPMNLRNKAFVLWFATARYAIIF